MAALFKHGFRQARPQLREKKKRFAQKKLNRNILWPLFLTAAIGPPQKMRLQLKKSVASEPFYGPTFKTRLLVLYLSSIFKKRGF